MEGGECGFGGYGSWRRDVVERPSAAAVAVEWVGTGDVSVKDDLDDCEMSFWWREERSLCFSWSLRIFGKR